MNIVGAIVGIYYNVVISYTFFYFFASFTRELPWTHCGNWWNDNKTCVEHHSRNTVGNASDNFTTSSPLFTTTSVYSNTTHVTGETPAAQYWNRYVLGRSDGMEHLGAPRWHLTLCLLLAWIIVFLCIIKGIKSAGKVAYFTATFPYVVLVILFFRGVTLPGASAGILYYITPRIEPLKHVKVWKDAAIQILYSLGPGFGSLISMGSFNKFNNNFQKDAIIVSIVNCGTSVFAGFVIFSVLGYMALETGIPVEDVGEEGPGLAFIAYPEALALMPGGPFWSIMFFFMLILLGVNSQFVGIQCFVTAISDDVKFLQLKKTRFTLCVCLLGFFLGIPCVTEGGIYLLELMDKYSTSFPLLIITLFETLVVSWVYGWRRLRSDIASMLGFKPNYYWISCWTGVAPIIIALLLILSCVEYTSPVYHISREELYKYPGWAVSLGWCMSMASIIMIPIFAIMKFSKCVGTLKNFVTILKGPMIVRKMKLESLWKPTDGWGPLLPENRVDQRSNQEGANVVAHYRSSDKLEDTDNPLKLDINFANGAPVIPVESHI